MKTRYFGGTPDNLGVVRALPAETFTDLVSTHLRQPVSLGVTKAQLLAMPPAASKRRPRAPSGNCQFLAIIASSSFRASRTYPRRCQNRHSAKASRTEVSGSGFEIAQSTAARMLSGRAVAHFSLGVSLNLTAP